MAVTQHGHFQFSANDCFLDQDLLIVFCRFLDAFKQFVAVTDFRDSDRAACIGGFDKVRIGTECFLDPMQFLRRLCGERKPVEHTVLRLADPALVCQNFTHDFIHRAGGGQYAGAGIRDACQFQEALHRAVFPVFAVQDGEDAVDTDILALFRADAVYASVRTDIGIPVVDPVDPRPVFDHFRRCRRFDPGTFLSDADHADIVPVPVYISKDRSC